MDGGGVEGAGPEGGGMEGAGEEERCCLAVRAALLSAEGEEVRTLPLPLTPILTLALALALALAPTPTRALSRLGLSLIDDSPQELLYLSAQALHLSLQP